MFNVGILTASDKCSKGEREDKSGKTIRELITQLNAQVTEYTVIPDERPLIGAKLTEWSDKKGVDLIITTGGTGFAPRDVTPEATLDVIDKAAPGIAEAMRAEGIKKTPHAMLSREVCGIRGRTLIINLPGSPKAVRECLETILPALPHAIDIIKGEASECADPEKG